MRTVRVRLRSLHMIPGAQPAPHRFRVKGDAGYDGGGWQCQSEAVPLKSAEDYSKYKMKPRQEGEHLAYIVVKWERPPFAKAEEIEYQFALTEHDRDDDPDTEDETLVYVLPGNQSGFMIDEFSGEPIIPDETFTIHLAYRYRDKAGDAGGGWVGQSGGVDVYTKKATHPAELLWSRVPRVFLLHSLEFKPNKGIITKGLQNIPNVAHICQECVGVALPGCVAHSVCLCVCSRVNLHCLQVPRPGAAGGGSRQLWAGCQGCQEALPASCYHCVPQAS